MDILARFHFIILLFRLLLISFFFSLSIAFTPAVIKNVVFRSISTGLLSLSSRLVVSGHSFLLKSCRCLQYQRMCSAVQSPLHWYLGDPIIFLACRGACSVCYVQSSGGRLSLDLTWTVDWQLSFVYGTLKRDLTIVFIFPFSDPCFANYFKQ